MADPITTDDLYGSSDEKKQDEPESHLGVPVEETPEITPPTFPAPDQKPVGKKSGCGGLMMKLVLFAGLVAAGVWVANNFRQFIPTNTQRESSGQLQIPTTPKVSTAPSGAEVATPSSTWKTYDVTSGTTKQPFAGVTFKLPPDVLSPICDGTSCSSQGTYLPGGTRFTVAARGTGQLLADYRGTAIADTRGTTFTTKQTTVAGLSALEFSGTFTGGTVSGYSFTSMRGVMIAITPTTSLEINHFTPNGIVADFAADDALFDEILKTVLVTL